jgi:hypothetical protein
MLFGVEVVSNWSKSGEKTLSLSGGFEFPHTSLSHSSRLVGILCTIIQPLVLSMFHTLEHLFLCRCVTLELVGHNYARHESLFLQQFAEKTLCRLRVSLSLQQDIQYVPLRIHSAPQVILLFFDRHHDFIEMPFICNVRAVALKLTCILLFGFLAPFPNRFLRHLNPAIQHHFLNIAVAQGKCVVEPDTVTDDFRGKAVTRIHMQNEKNQGVIPYSISSLIFS